MNGARIVRLLRKKNFPTDLEVYKELERIDPVSLQLVKKNDPRESAVTEEEHGHGSA